MSDQRFFDLWTELNNLHLMILFVNLSSFHAECAKNGTASSYPGLITRQATPASCFSVGWSVSVRSEAPATGWPVAKMIH